MASGEGYAWLLADVTAVKRALEEEADMLLRTLHRMHGRAAPCGNLMLARVGGIGYAIGKLDDLLRKYDR